MRLLAQHFTSKGGIDAAIKPRNISPPSRNHLPPALGVEPRISGSRADIATVEPSWPPFWVPLDTRRVLINNTKIEGGWEEEKNGGRRRRLNDREMMMIHCLYSLYFRA